MISNTKCVEAMNEIDHALQGLDSVLARNDRIRVSVTRLFINRLKDHLIDAQISLGEAGVKVPKQAS